MAVLDDAFIFGNMYIKKSIIVLATALFMVSGLQAQLLNKVIKSVSKDSSAGNVLSGISQGTSSLSTEDVAAGLKEALEKGTETGTAKLSAVDGFLKNAAIKILLPPEAQKAEQVLRSAGLGKLADNAISSMNHAAEDASKSAAPIFVNAIKQMTIQDAWAILKGADTSATHYLKTKTTDPLTTAFKPVIEQSLKKTDATKYWTDFATAYNKINVFGSNKLDTDLPGYVTGKALTGIFYEIGQQEKDIRKNPAARTTALLQKVFGSSN
ncbi:DUF4197 domain-containing protein [Parafilimonas sp.]|uniref:DUF4197 domain-containing protein n=1 Tax=Parafilimonas sp. TaxID=1969739 RepID=UPI0039E24FAF